MFNNASILVTGATGSFGQTCLRELLRRFKARRIIVFSRDELKQLEMREEFNTPEIRYFLGDVRDERRLKRALEGIDYVIHAAAVKQVPALEYNPSEAVKTNILGAENVISCSLETGVKQVIALSTDKAALPVNLYGATKLVSDSLFIAANNIRGASGTRFSVVRYGNVLGSRGSVIPHFRKLLAKGATRLPITDDRMTRFCLTLEQGVDFVVKAFQRMRGGELYVPKIPSLRIIDLVEAMSSAGRYEVVGIRPGEKLHEVLIPSDLSRRTLEFADHYVIQPVFNLSEEIDYSTNLLGETGAAVSDDFEYRSDGNPHLLSVAELKSLLADIR